MRMAMDNLAFKKSDFDRVSLNYDKKTRADFEFKSGEPKEIVDARFEHYKKRIIENFNNLLSERKRIINYKPI